MTKPRLDQQMDQRMRLQSPVRFARPCSHLRFLVPPLVLVVAFVSPLPPGRRRIFDTAASARASSSA